MFLTKGDFYINNQDEFDCFLEWSWKNRCGNQERCIDYLEKLWIAYCRYFDIEYNPFDNNLSPLYTDEEFEEILYYLRTDVDLFEINDDYELAQIRFAVMHFHEFIIIYYEF